jgi:hypothetical protein
MSTHASAWARARIVVSVVVIGAIVAVAALARTTAARDVASSIGIRTAREPYTALSFTHPDTLGYGGVTYRRHVVHDRLGFTVRNEEHRRTRYRWTISFSPHGRRYHGAVAVAAGAAATVRRRVLLPCARLTYGRPRSKPSPRVRVRVALMPSHEAIDYWQVCGG